MKIAKITGQYRHRVRGKILWFWVVMPWKTTPFEWQREVEIPELHLAYDPIPSLPLSIALDVDETSAHFGLKLMNGPELWGQTVPVLASAEQSFRFEPWKGVILEGMGSFEELTS